MSRAALWRLAIIAGLASACGLLYEMIFARALTAIVADVLPVQTTTLIFYLGGMGLGSFASDRVGDARKLNWIVTAGLAAAALAIFAEPVLQGIYFVYKYYIFSYSADIGAQVASLKRAIIYLAQPVPLLMGFFSGLEFSLFVRLGRGLNEKLGAPTILAANYLGAVVAAMLFALSLIMIPPFLGFIAVSGAAACLYILVSWRLMKDWARRIGVGAGAVLLLAGALLIPCFPAFEQLALKSRYAGGVKLLGLRLLPNFVFRELLGKPDAIRLYTRYQIADFVPLNPRGISFFLDGHPQLDPDWSQNYHESLVHAPIQFFGEIPKKVLILGGGDGIAAGELLRYGEKIQRIDLIELDPAILELARENMYFLKQNHGALTDPKVHVEAEDAIAFLRTHAGTYDLIVADFPLPFDYDLLKLFSVEFYRLVRRHLDEHGTFVFDSGILQEGALGGDQAEWNGVLLSTLREAGFTNVIPYLGNEVFVAARNDEAHPDSSLKDFGLTFQFVTAEFLKSALAVKIESQGNAINSIFKPRMHTLKSFDF